MSDFRYDEAARERVAYLLGLITAAALGLDDDHSTPQTARMLDHVHRLRKLLCPTLLPRDDVAAADE